MPLAPRGEPALTPQQQAFKERIALLASNKREEDNMGEN
jgi:hypothetical protein